RQFAGAAGPAEDVQIQGLDEDRVDVTEILRRGQEKGLDLLLRAAVLQEADPAVPAALVCLPAQELQVKGIDDAAERFLGLEDGIDDGGLALFSQEFNPEIEFIEIAAPAEHLDIEPLHETLLTVQRLSDIDGRAGSSEYDAGRRGVVIKHVPRGHNCARR